MIPITYFRSSSYNAWDLCPHQMFMSYFLNVKQPSGLKAVKGNIVHKALELLARQKKALQDGLLIFREDETGLQFPSLEFTVEEAIEVAWNHYTQRETNHTWKPRDKKDCVQWTWDALTIEDGRWDVRKARVIQPELFFDLQIEQPWAKYSYELPDGSKLDGYLGIKGTVDLITEVAGLPNTYEYIDWKTGRRLDWANGEEKTWKKLRHDPQLRLYHYALSKLFPDKAILMSIVFVRDGGGFTLPFGPDDVVATEKMLRRRFETIRNCVRPKLKVGWKCRAFCAYGKTQHGDSGKTQCEHYRDEIVQLGLDGAMKKHADFSKIGVYTEGGGRSEATLAGKG